MMNITIEDELHTLDALTPAQAEEAAGDPVKMWKAGILVVQGCAHNGVAIHCMPDWKNLYAKLYPDKCVEVATQAYGSEGLRPKAEGLRKKKTEKKTKEEESDSSLTP
jgi:hypothetical protein